MSVLLDHPCPVNALIIQSACFVCSCLQAEKSPTSSRATENIIHIVVDFLSKMLLVCNTDGPHLFKVN